jgi:hypothetical protein
VLNLGRDDAWRGRSLVSNREMLRILFVLLQKHEEPPFPHPQDLLNILSFDFILGITVKKLFDLI